jgi:PAS domain S-box-containing protein
MHEALQAILGADWFPHVFVLRTKPDTPWIPAFNNLSIAAAHFGIILVLWQVMRKRKESEFRWIALLFGMFNGIRCLTQSLGIWPFWHLDYELHWGFRAATAVLAVATAVALVQSLPALHRLPSASDLEKEIEERRRAEEAALEKEERLRNFVESVQDYAMYMVDLEGVIQSWNSGAERMTGYSADEMIGHNCSRFLSPEDGNGGRTDESLRIVKETGRFEGESRLLRKDGSPLLVHITMRPLLGPSGNLRGFSKVTRDITETRDLEAKYRILLNATPDGILIIDDRGRIQFANERIEFLFGYICAELLGKDCAILTPVHLRERQRLRYEEFFRDPESFVMEHDAEASGLRKDGSVFHVEATLRPLHSPGGVVAVISVRDVTERVKNEARFRTLLESAPDAMVISGSNGLIELTNLAAERLYGYSQAEMIGQPVEMLIPPDLRAEYRRDLQAIPQGEAARKAGAGKDVRALRKDGTEIPVEISFSPLEGPHGMSLTAAVRDISERRFAEEAIREREERFRDFVDSVEDYAIYMIDPEGVIQTWNHGAERMKGYTAEEIIGENFSRFYTTEDLALGQPQEALKTAGEKGFFRDEGWRMRKDGTRFLVNVTMRPLRDAHGALRGFSKVTRDITESRELETRFQVLLEAAPDAFLIVNRAGEIEFINAQGEKTFGYVREEVLGKSVDMFNPERVREMQAVYRDQLFSGAGRAEGGSDTDLWGLRKDGTEFPLEFTLSPLDTREGRVFLFAIRDITERKKAETRFRALLESAPDAMVIVNSKGCIELVNRQTEKLFGYSRMELAGQSVDILVPLDLRRGHSAHRDHFFASPKPRSMGAGLDLLALRKDGTQFPVEISLSPLEGPDGISVTAAIRDVTERKKAETRFRALLESAPDAMVIVNSEGSIELTNLQTEKLFGYSRAELLGQPVDMLVPLDLRSGHAAHRDRFFASPKPRQMGAGFDLEARRKDGTLFPVEISLSPLEGPDGISVTAAIRDVTERKKAETRFRALLESAPDAMVIVNSDGYIELANLQTEKLFGFSRLELVGKSVDILVPLGLQEAHAGHRAEFFRNPKKREMGANLDLMALRKDRTQFPVEISLSPLEGPDGISVTAAIRDISERRAAARQLAEKMAELHQSNEALEQFAHIASHDLQEPLRMVASYTQLLSRRYKGRLDADADEFIDFAVDGTQRMKRLIEDLLLYSRSGKGAPPMVEFDANGSFREAVNNLRVSIEESHAEVTADPLPRLAAVESQLVQLLQNLIGNAIKYRGDRIPRIHVSAAEGCREWTFSVADNGIGIDSKYFDRIFQIFQRLHGRGEYEGTGIGLAICKRILQQQGGRIWVESEPGKGSVFHFSLPMR